MVLLAGIAGCVPQPTPTSPTHTPTATATVMTTPTVTRVSIPTATITYTPTRAPSDTPTSKVTYTPIPVASPTLSSLYLMVLRPSDLPAAFSLTGKDQGTSVLNGLVYSDDDQGKVAYIAASLFFEDAFSLTYTADNPMRILVNQVFAEREEDAARDLLRASLIKDSGVKQRNPGLNVTVTPIQIPRVGTESVALSINLLSEKGGLYTTIITWRYNRIVSRLALVSLEQFPPEDLAKLARVVQARLEEKK